VSVNNRECWQPLSWGVVGAKGPLRNQGPLCFVGQGGRASSQTGLFAETDLESFAQKIFAFEKKNQSGGFFKVTAALAGISLMPLRSIGG